MPTVLYLQLWRDVTNMSNSIRKESNSFFSTHHGHLHQGHPQITQNEVPDHPTPSHRHAFHQHPDIHIVSWVPSQTSHMYHQHPNVGHRHKPSSRPSHHFHKHPSHVSAPGHQSHTFHCHPQFRSWTGEGGVRTAHTRQENKEAFLHRTPDAMENTRRGHRDVERQYCVSGW